jgi:two-component system KDP operon response regulator KdpE
MTNHNLAFIIEDNPILSASIAKVLELEGLKTEQIADGKQALFRLSVEAPRLVILDLNLPNVSGVEILEFINHSLHLVNTITVVASADAIRAESLEHRAHMVLVKPFSTQQLAALCRRLIKDPQAYI